jgi:adenosylhomocysteine nucleosidase
LLAFIAAEGREFGGLNLHLQDRRKLAVGLQFAVQGELNGMRVVLAADGAGPKCAARAVEAVKAIENLSGLISTGLCGALDPALVCGDIFIATGPGHNLPTRMTKPYRTGTLISQDRVATTPLEKAALRATGAGAVEMEAAAVAAKAQEYNIPFYCIRVVGDTANEALPLDFNQMRDAEGRFSRWKIIGAALRDPLRIFPELITLQRTSKSAALALGDFLANSRF